MARLVDAALRLRIYGGNVAEAADGRALTALIQSDAACCLGGVWHVAGPAPSSAN